MKKLISAILILASIICLSSCTNGQTGSSGDTTSTPQNTPDFDYTVSSEPTNHVKIEMMSGDIMIIELYPNEAPITVENFKNLVSQKYYDGTIFHRVINGFMIQGGAGASTPSIKGEFALNGVQNNIKHERGVISMARSNAVNSATSQFFICHTTDGCEHLNGYYAAFGKLIFGFETLDMIAKVQTDYRDVPVIQQKMKSVCFIQVELNTSTADTTDATTDTMDATADTVDAVIDTTDAAADTTGSAAETN